MVNQLIEKFGEIRVNNCLSLNNQEEFYIVENDETSQSYIVFDEEKTVDYDKCFIIGNDSEKEISHLAIDACFLTPQNDYHGEKCDFVVFSDNKFCFVELKSNAESERGIYRNLKKARSQLGATIDFFDDNEVDFLEHQLEAYIVLRNRLYPTDSAGKKARRKAFFDKYEVDLLEESETEF